MGFDKWGMLKNSVGSGRKTQPAVAVGKTAGLLLLLLPLNVCRLRRPLLTGQLLNRRVKSAMKTDVLLRRYASSHPPPWWVLMSSAAEEVSRRQMMQRKDR